jgi:hypothetical protein
MIAMLMSLWKYLDRSNLSIASKYSTAKAEYERPLTGMNLRKNKLVEFLGETAQAYSRNGPNSCTSLLKEPGLDVRTIDDDKSSRPLLLKK